MIFIIYIYIYILLNLHAGSVCFAAGSSKTSVPSSRFEVFSSWFGFGIYF